jgi:hypothetical protein
MTQKSFWMAPSLITKMLSFQHLVGRQNKTLFESIALMEENKILNNTKNFLYFSLYCNSETKSYLRICNQGPEPQKYLNLKFMPPVWTANKNWEAKQKYISTSK